MCIRDSTGGGGGGGSRSASGSCNGGYGGSGIVILRYASKYTLVNNTPGTLTTGVLNGTVGDDKYTTFTAGTGTISGLNLDIAIGTMRENTTTGNMEIYTGAKGWRALQQTGQDVGIVPTNNFNTALYTGNATARAIDVGFKPDFTWIKDRITGYSHALVDSVRGPSSELNSNDTSAEYTETNGLTAFTSTGFNLGNLQYSYNQTSNTYVSWNWKAGGAATTISGVGTINSDVSANTAVGFSIVKWAGYNTSGTTVAHGLGKKPDLMITKNITTIASWPVFYKDAITTSDTTFTLPASTNYWLGLNDTWAYTTFTLDQQFGGQSGGTGSDQMISYCWTSIPGYSLISTYTGTGGTDFPIIYTGFAPAWLMIKRTDSTGNWCIYDNKRDTTNPNNAVLAANSSNAESYYTSGYEVNFYNNGFQIAVGPSVDINADGGDYIFMCFAS